MENKCKDVKGDETDKVIRKSIENVILVIYKLREFYDEWGRSQVPPSDEEELNAAERIVKEIFKVIDKIDKANFPPYFSENHRSEAKKGLIALRLMIDEEKSKKTTKKK